MRREQRVVGRVPAGDGHERALHGAERAAGRVLGGRPRRRLPRRRVDFREQSARVNDGLVHAEAGAVGGHEARARRVGDAAERGTENRAVGKAMRRYYASLHG